MSGGDEVEVVVPVPGGWWGLLVGTKNTYIILLT